MSALTTWRTKCVEASIVVMFVQSKAFALSNLRASGRFAVSLASLVRYYRGDGPFSSPSSVTQVCKCMSHSTSRSSCSPSTNARGQCILIPNCLGRSLLHSSGSSDQLEGDQTIEKSIKRVQETAKREAIGLPRKQRKIRSQLEEFSLDENGYLLIEELVRFLNKEGALDMSVIETSGNRRSYVDYFVVASGASTRHIKAMAKNLEQLVRQVLNPVYYFML